MPKWLKVVLIILAAALGLCCLGSGAAYAWLYRHKDELKDAAKTASQEGRAFGKLHDAEGCVDDGLRRLRAQRGLVEQATNRMFLQACLEVAAKPEGFCRDVPARTDVVAIATWSVQRCAAKGAAGDQDCARLMQVVQRACTGE
ncbi:MAG: hypothetical protein ACOZQL_41850 [Myxococcota bacterium]